MTIHELPRNPTRAVRIGSIVVGSGHPVAIQSMCATKTRDVDATAAQVADLVAAGADIVRIAVDGRADAEAAIEIARRVPEANLCIDLQENYRLATLLAPHVAKIRYNPGHLHHHERDRPWREKVRTIADAARDGDCALRIGVNCGSVDPARLTEGVRGDSISPMVESALEHAAWLDELGVDRFVVSLKDSDPEKVILANQRFAEARPDVPLHLGVTEAGLPPDGVIKTRIAFEQLLSRGIGDTVRVSLTVPNARKGEEIAAAREIIDDLRHGRTRSVVHYDRSGLNIISCPSCSRVENEAFVGLAEEVREMTRYAQEHAVTIAVMGCRVNGPGETDDADLGLWCAPSFVHLKRGEESLGTYPYDEILGKLRLELDALIARR